MNSTSLSTEYLFNRACEIYGEKPLAETLFNSEIPVLGNNKPIALMQTPEGCKLVNEWLNKIEAGEYS